MIRLQFSVLSPPCRSEAPQTRESSNQLSLSCCNSTLENYDSPPPPPPPSFTPLLLPAPPPSSLLPPFVQLTSLALPSDGRPPRYLAVVSAGTLRTLAFHSQTGPVANLADWARLNIVPSSLVTEESRRAWIGQDASNTLEASGAFVTGRRT